ncbi:MAG: methyltransferase domain-containing protein [Gallionellaceae bacterium]
MSQVAKKLDGHAMAYDCSFPYYEENRIVHAAYGDRIAQHIAERKLRSVLSLGIGHSEVARRILDQFNNAQLKRYVIVDGAPKIIDSFRQSLAQLPRGLELIEGFFESFTYPSRFDVIEAGFILEHVDDPALILRRLHQFLAPGARLFIAVPNARSLHRLLGHHAGLLRDMYALSPADIALGHKRYFDVSSLAALVQDAGFRIERTEGMLLKPFTTEQLGKLDLPPAIWRALQTVAADYPAISNAIYIEATACV